MPGCSGQVLPLGLDAAGHRVEWATAEITGHGTDSVSFGAGLDRDGRTTILLAAGATVAPDPAYDVAPGVDGRVRVTGGPGPLTVRFG